MYYTYMVRCTDDSIYTGITTDIDRRFNEHKNKTKYAAKYTMNHNVVKLEAIWISDNKSDASKLEYHIKKLRKSEKEMLISDNSLENLLMYKIDIDKYTRKL